MNISGKTDEIQRRSVVIYHCKYRAFFVFSKGFDKKMQRIFLIHFLKTVFHAVTKGKRGEYWRTGGRMGSSGDVILRFFLRNGLFSGVE